MKVLSKRLGCKPEFVDVDNSYQALSKYIGGDIIPDHLTVTNGEIGSVVLSDEEMTFAKEKKNCKMFNSNYYGNLIICGYYNAEFTDIPWDEKLCRVIFGELWEDK